MEEGLDFIPPLFFVYGILMHFMTGLVGGELMLTPGCFVSFRLF